VGVGQLVGGVVAHVELSAVMRSCVARFATQDVNHPNYVAGRRAVKRVFGVEPDLTREGGSIPITLKFEEATGKNVLMLPVGQGDDGAHSQNEKFSRVNYINAIKVLGVYFHELASL
jgi:cytosolic nonspecific dipeptidase